MGVTVRAVSWVEYEDSVLGRVVVELQPTVVEVFRTGAQETTRIHLRMLAVEMLGPNERGDHQVRLTVTGGPGVTLTASEQWWARLWPWVEQVRHAQVAYSGY